MKSLVSSEFAALCQGQLRLLAQSTGASLGAVYIAEEWLGGDSSGWLPVAIHPENVAASFGGMGLLAPVLEGSVNPGSEERWMAEKEPRELLGSPSQDLDPYFVEEPLPSSSQVEASPAEEGGLRSFLSARLRRWQRAMEKGPDEVLSASKAELETDWELDSGESRAGLLHQAMQPLLFDGRAVGMVVAARAHRDWQLDDYSQLEKIAQTLSNACAMERRLQWLQTRVHQQEIAQEKQQDIIDNLLHQFRNPLTALRTFGKLLVRRLSPEDRNQAVAAGIVRESDRLQGLLTQIGETVDSFAVPEAVMGELVAAPSSPELPRLPPGEQSSNHSGDSPASKQEENGTTLALPQGELPALPAARTDEMDDLVSPLTGKPLVLGHHLVSHLIGERLPSWEAIAQVQGQLVMASLESELPAVLADGDALGEVLSNLVDNGLKYGSPGGSVAIAVRSVSDFLPDGSGIAQTGPEAQEHEAQPLGIWQCIAISDDGPGIPKEDLPRLFERHYRGVQAEGSKPGTGLGLAIAKALVEQMGGHIVIQSPAGPFHPKVAFGLDEALEPASHPGSAFLIWLKVAAPHSAVATE